MTSKEPEYRLVRFQGVEVQLYACLIWPRCNGKFSERSTVNEQS